MGEYSNPHYFDGCKPPPNFHPTFTHGNLLSYAVIKCSSSLLEFSLCNHFTKFFPPLKGQGSLLQVACSHHRHLRITVSQFEMNVSLSTENKKNK